MTREQLALGLIERLRNTGRDPIDQVWQRWQQLFREYDAAVAGLPADAAADVEYALEIGGSILSGSTELADPEELQQHVPGSTLVTRTVTATEWVPLPARCGVAFVGHDSTDGSCEQPAGHVGRHWSAQWGSWSL